MYAQFILAKSCNVLFLLFIATESILTRPIETSLRAASFRRLSMVSSTFFGSFCAFAGGGRRNAVHKAAETSNFVAGILCVKVFFFFFWQKFFFWVVKTRYINNSKVWDFL